jgi:transaldolase
MKIFLDTADPAAIRRAHATGLLDGVTTNPSLVAKQGRGFRELVSEICQLTPGPVSVEAVAEHTDELVAAAREVAAIAPNVVVKLPMTPAGCTAARLLEHEHAVRVNITMVFSATQVLLAMKTGASFVSIVLSRLDAAAMESEPLVQDAVTIKRNYGFRSEIIAGSVKTQNHVLSCLRAGIDVVTVPESLWLQMFQHPLTDAGLAQFAQDWRQVPA